MPDSDAADVNYEELNKEIANLRQQRGFVENRVIDLERQLRDVRANLEGSELKYQQLLKDSFKIISENNGAIVRLIEKIDGGSSW